MVFSIFFPKFAIILVNTINSNVMPFSNINFTS